MTIARFLDELAGRGIQVWAEGGALRYRAPSGTLNAELRAELAARKADVLSFLARLEAAEQGVPSRDLPKVTPAPERRGEPFPLTDVQQAYWLGAGSGFELGGVSAHVYLEHQLPGLDIARLTGAWQRLVEHHEMLRAVVLPDGRQRILREVPAYRAEIEDLQGVEPELAAERLAAVRGRMAREGPSLDRWPLFELRFTRLDGGFTRIHLAISLMICDAWSFWLLFRDLGRLYGDPAARLPQPGLSYRDYVLALDRIRETEPYRRSQAYWWARLEDLPAAPELPLAANPAALGRPRFVRRAAELDPETWRRFKERAMQAGVTATVALCTAYAQVLAAWSKEPRFLLNVLFFQRLPLHPEVGDVVGNFSSTLLLEVDVSGPGGFAERALRVQERLWQDIEHSHVTGVSLLRELSRRDGGAARRIAPVVFASSLNLGGGTRGPSAPPSEEARGWRAVYSSLQTPQVWLDHQVSERFGALALNWDAVEDLFPAGLLDDMFAAYRALLRDLANGGEAWEETGRSLTPAEQLAVRAAVNATEAPLPEGLLQSGFLAWAARDPGRAAVVTSARTITYGELRAGADRLGRRLRELGARPGRLVAVVMEKGWEQVLGVLAVLQSGAAYLPIDPAVPAERLRYLLDQGEVDLALTQPWLLGRLEWPPSVSVLKVEAGALAGDAPALGPAQTQQDIAYVIFTSGSTGLPKGVVIDHRGALNTIADVNRRFAVGPEDRVLALSALNFDLSVYDIFGLLAAGGAVVVPDAADLREPARWASWLSSAGVTLWSSVPALLEMLVDFLEGHSEPLPGSLRLVLLSGDWIPVTLPDRARALGAHLEIISLGGATEASIWSVLHPIEEVDPAWPSIPYGRPMDNQRLHVLGPSLEPRPDWVPGQLYIGGAGLALGYWRDEEKTSASFIVHPRTGERLYRTGDLGRYLPQGDIEFLGREDFQVKVQGFRIELGEVESTLLQHPAVRACAAVAVGERTGSKRLVAYAVPDPGTEAGVEDLEAFLRRKLPGYMVPSQLTLLSELPLTSNGKVDRTLLQRPAALAKPGGSRKSVPPRDELERQLAEIWREILDAEAVGATDSFFDLGGHSLLAVRLMARLEHRFGQAFPLSTLFAAPTVERQAALLRGRDGVSRGGALVAIQPSGSREPFFCVHPVGGNVLCYQDLAHRLGQEQPFYALQVPEGASEADLRLEEMAAEYLRAVRERCPAGPYRLGGWSMGGVVAFEMARQLRAEGEAVELLALFDAERPRRGGDAAVDDAQLAAWFARDLGGLLGCDLAMSPDELRPLSPEDRLRRLTERVRASDPPNEIGHDTLRRLFAIFRRNYRSMLRYEAPVYEGSLCLLRAAPPEVEEDATLGWGAVAAGGVEVLLVPGDHYTLLRPPCVDTLAAALQDCLATGSVPERAGRM